MAPSHAMVGRPRILQQLLNSERDQKFFFVPPTRARLSARDHSEEPALPTRTRVPIETLANKPALPFSMRQRAAECRASYLSMLPADRSGGLGSLHPRLRVLEVRSAGKRPVGGGEQELSARLRQSAQADFAAESWKGRLAQPHQAPFYDT